MILTYTISFDDLIVGYFSSGNAYDTLLMWIYSLRDRKNLFGGIYAFFTTITILMIVGIIVFNFIMKGVHKHDKD